jgi:hypothetical protein
MKNSFCSVFHLFLFYFLLFGRFIIFRCLLAIFYCFVVLLFFAIFWCCCLLLVAKGRLRHAVIDFASRGVHNALPGAEVITAVQPHLVVRVAEVLDAVGQPRANAAVSRARPLLGLDDSGLCSLDNSRFDGRRLDSSGLRRRLNRRRGNLGRFRSGLLEVFDALGLRLFRVLRRLGVGLVEFLGRLSNSLLLFLDALRFREFNGLLRSSLANSRRRSDCRNGRNGVGRVELRAELLVELLVRSFLRLGSPALSRERHGLRHDNLLAVRVFRVNRARKDVRAVHQLRGGVLNLLLSLAGDELFPAVGESVLQRHLDPATRLAELRRLNALRRAARLFRDDFRAVLHLLLGLERRLLDDFEQVGALKLLERGEHG